MNDTDWFKIALTAGKTYQFDLKGSLSGQGTLADPFLRLRDGAGNPVTDAFANDGGNGTDSRFVYTVPIAAGGTYYVVAGSNNGGTGTYKVSVTDDDYSASTATLGTITPGSSKSGNIQAVGDTDWFKTTLTAGRTYQFDLEGSATGQGTLADTFLRLRDSSGNPVPNAFNDDGGTGFNASFIYSPTTSGTYFLAAGTGYNIDGTGTYLSGPPTLRSRTTILARPPPLGAFSSEARSLETSRRLSIPIGSRSHSRPATRTSSILRVRRRAKGRRGILSLHCATSPGTQ